MSAILEVSGLRKSFGGVHAVKDVSLHLAQGEMLALIGPNGAGKTTCFNMLDGHLRPDAGSVRLDGKEIAGMRPRQVWRLGVGRTFQITATFSSMLVRENVQMALISHHRLGFSAWTRATRLFAGEAEALLARAGLAESAGRPCSELSYGDLKRLEIAMALAHEPRMLLMDEPTAGMAPAERHALMNLVSEIAEQGGVSVLFTEHDMDMVFGHARRIVVLNRGEVLAEGDPESIRRDSRVGEVYLGSLAGESAESKANA